MESRDQSLLLHCVWNDTGRQSNPVTQQPWGLACDILKHKKKELSRVKSWDEWTSLDSDWIPLHPPRPKQFKSTSKS